MLRNTMYAESISPPLHPESFLSQGHRHDHYTGWEEGGLVIIFTPYLEYIF